MLAYLRLVFDVDRRKDGPPAATRRSAAPSDLSPTAPALAEAQEAPAEVGDTERTRLPEATVPSQ